MKFENKVKGLYFFTFASGSYSDYGVNSLAVCDHAISEDEWYEHLKQHRVDSQNKKEELEDKYDVEDYISYGTDAYKEWAAWLGENDPDITFAKKHGMVFVEYQECHKDD